MAYDEGLAERLRSILDERRGVTEKQMFGGLAFLLDGRMCCGIVKDELMARVGAEGQAAAVKQPHVRPMDFTGRPLKGFVFVGQEGLDSDEQLEAWVTQGISIAQALEVRQPRAMPTKKPTAKVSPLKGMPVSEWVEKKSKGWQQQLIRRLLRIAKAAAPKATVSIKWSQPVLEQNGPLAWIKPAKAHVTFGFWRGAQLSDPKQLLEGGSRMKHWKLKSAADLDEKRLAVFVRQAVKLNVELGDPSRR